RGAPAGVQRLERRPDHHRRRDGQAAEDPAGGPRAVHGGDRRMTFRYALALAACLAACSAVQAATFKVLLLERADDPRLERSVIERAYLGHAGGAAFDGIDVALKEAQFELDAGGAAVTLERAAVPDAPAARDAAARAQKAGHVAIVADLPADWLLAAADAAQVPVLNVGESADRLRERDCRARL